MSALPVGLELAQALLDVLPQLLSVGSGAHVV